MYQNEHTGECILEARYSVHSSGYYFCLISIEMVMLTILICDNHNDNKHGNI